MARVLAADVDRILARPRRAWVMLLRGHWFARCGGCGRLEAVTHRTDRFTCPGCPRGEAVLAWPCDRDAIEAILRVRPIENRSWIPGETRGDLASENRERGFEGESD